MLLMPTLLGVTGGDGLAAGTDVNMLNRHFLPALSTMPVQRLNLRPESPRQFGGHS